MSYRGQSVSGKPRARVAGRRCLQDPLGTLTRYFSMNAATAVLVFCLVAVVLGEPCPRRPTPFFDCNLGPSGIFFPHPEDCTFLVVCISNQPVVVSLCEETDYLNVNDPKYSLGCPKECALIQPTDCEVTYRPGFPYPPGAEPSTAPPENSHFETQQEAQTGVEPDVEHNAEAETHPEIEQQTVPHFPFPNTTEPQATTLPPIPTFTSANPWFSRPSPKPFPPTLPSKRPYPITSYTQRPSPDPHQLNCKISGIVVHPYDCMKAFVCPSVGIQAILFNICENISRDSTFPVGCPEMCPGWLPGVMSANKVPQLYSMVI